jgi:hypothetical protein
VRTCIDKTPQVSIALAGHENRLPSNVRRVVIARILYLAFVTEKNPPSLEERFDFRSIKSIIDINRSIDTEYALLNAIVHKCSNICRSK